MRNIAASIFGWRVAGAAVPVNESPKPESSRPMESPRGSHQVESRDGPQLLRRRPSWHAEHFLQWLRSSDWGVVVVTAGVAKLTTDDVKRAYAEWCADELIEPRHWSPVAAHFNRLSRICGRPRKPYRWEADELTGERRKVRIYLIDIRPSVTCVQDDQPTPQAMAA